jgi:predicted hotdog family 3-hydroxylacyl-ACP dehydratase
MLELGIRYAVEDLVPHRGAMSLLDTIDDYGPDWLRAGVTPRRSTPFAQARGVPTWVGIEYMAQAASAFGGIEQVQQGFKPSIGLLIGSRYYRAVHTFLEFDAPLVVLATIAMRDAEDFAAYECTLTAGDRRVAECTLKAYRPRDLSPHLEEAARG